MYAEPQGKKQTPYWTCLSSSCCGRIALPMQHPLRLLVSHRVLICFENPIARGLARAGGLR